MVRCVALLLVPQRLHPEKRDLRTEKLFVSQCFERVRQRGFDRLVAHRQPSDDQRDAAGE